MIMNEGLPTTITQPIDIEAIGNVNAEAIGNGKVEATSNLKFK